MTTVEDAIYTNPIITDTFSKTKTEPIGICRLSRIVRSQLIDTKTGDTFTPLDDLYDRDTILTAREIEILKKIAQGLLSKEIAGMLGLSVHTVNTHRQRILAKLNVNNSIEALSMKARQVLRLNLPP